MRDLFPAISLIVAISASVPVLAQTGDPARSTIEAFDDALIGIMKSGKAAGIRGRIAVISPAVDRAFDLPLMTRLSVGPAWTTIAPVDQMALVVAFRRMTISQYASNFSDFSGQSFTVAQHTEARAGDRLVRTTLNDAKRGGVAIAYRLRQSGGDWKIIDVFYRNSVSQLAIRRSDFADVLASGGASALTTHLNALAAKVGG